MTDPTPEQQVQEQIQSLGYKIERLQSDVRLTSLRDAVGSLDTKITGLKPCIQDLREQGYAFGKGFEDKAAGFASQWQDLKPRVLREIDMQMPPLEVNLRPLESQFNQVRGSTNVTSLHNMVESMNRTAESLDDRISAVKRSIEGMYSSLESEVGQFKTELDRISEMLEKFAAASFRLLPTECAVMAVKATYSRDEKMDNQDPQGFLFLTDQRLLFEQNQEIATKKVLFITTEKQKVQKLLLEVPVALTDQIQANKKGLFGHEDHLALTFKSGAPVIQSWFHLDGQDCNEWKTFISQARSAGFEPDRAVAVDQAEVNKVKSAPSQCPNCGAPVTQVVLRGMDSISCEYCQHVIRL